MQNELMMRQKKSGLGKKILNNWQLYLFVVPALAYYIMLEYLPMYGVQIAFKDYSARRGIWGSQWVGLEHFARFFRSPQSVSVIMNTLKISLVNLLLGFPLPIIFALFLNEIRCERWKNVVKTVSYAPHFISTVVLAGMIRLFLAPSSGIFNHLIALLGGQRVAFLQEARYFVPIVVFSSIWQELGWSSMIYFAALSGVEEQQTEAAILDGANQFQRIWHINLPVLRSTITIMLIMSVGQIMSVGYEKIYLLQTSTNLSTSEIISTYVYKCGLANADYSYSAAVGLFNSVVNCVLLILANWLSKRTTEVGLW